jgi:hypothetical protein
MNCFYKRKINDVKVKYYVLFNLSVLVAKIIVIYFHWGNVFRGGEGGLGVGRVIFHTQMRDRSLHYMRMNHCKTQHFLCSYRQNCLPGLYRIEI